MDFVYILVFITAVGVAIAYPSDDVQHILREIRQMRQDHTDQIRTCGQKVDVIIAENRQLLQRMNVLERENEIMFNRISALENKNKQYDKSNPVHALINATFENSHVDIISLPSSSSTTSSTYKDTRAETNDNQRITSDIDDNPLISTKEKRISKTGFLDKAMTKEKRVGDTTNAVGFYAALAPDVSLGDQQDLKFDHVYTNIGQGYEPRDGHFRAPVAGLYLISATVLSSRNTPDDMLLELVKNGANVGQIYATRSLNEGSRVIVLSLDVGDMVWIRHMIGDPGTVANGSHYSSFSGVLIAAFGSTRVVG